MNKSQRTLIHVGDGRRDEGTRIQMNAKWQESSATSAHGKAEVDSRTQMGEVRTKHILRRLWWRDGRRGGRGTVQ